MDKFNIGDVVYHKATKKRYVIIKMNDNKTIKVRTETDEEKDYYPQELETLQEIQARNQNLIGQIPNSDPYY